MNYRIVWTATLTLELQTSPLPPPLLPLVTRLNMQVNLLTQPRHIDSISRRLKLLLSDLERAAQHSRHNNKHSSNGPPLSDHSQTLLPLLTRLTPLLPHIPHILTRLRTLSALHTSAAEFSRTLSALEEEQRKMRDGLNVLESAVGRVEGSAQENSAVVSLNVKGLDGRVEKLLERLAKLEHQLED